MNTSTINNAADIAILQAPQDAMIMTDMTGSEPAPTAGQFYYANNRLNMGNAYGTNLQIGQEQYIEISNATGSIIPNGSAVYMIGLSGGLPSVGLAIANSFSTARILGVATMDIADGTNGLITTFGLVHEINTNGFTPGVPLYLSDTVPGGFTETPPEILSQIGIVLVSDLTIGEIIVSRSNLINLPTVLAYMNAGTAGGTLTEDVITDVINYANAGNIFMPYDANTGEITIPSNGIYGITVNMTLEYDAIGNAEEDFDILIRGTINGDTVIPVKLPRNSTGTSFSISQSFNASVNEVVTVALRPVDSTLTGVSYGMMGFEIESKNIR